MALSVGAKVGSLHAGHVRRADTELLAKIHQQHLASFWLQPSARGWGSNDCALENDTGVPMTVRALPLKELHVTSCASYGSDRGITAS